MAMDARHGAAGEAAGVRARPAGRSRIADRAVQRVMDLTVLGSGDAFGAGGRFHAAYVVETEGAAFLLDCGPSVLQSAKRVSWDLARLDAVVLTHLHGDHFGGVPFLFMEYKYEAPRTRPLLICGPAGTERRVQGLFAALYEQTAREPLPFPVEYRELSVGESMQLGAATLTPIPAVHVPELACFGYRVEVAGRTLVYSGDTAWTEDLARHARGADVFICECSTYDTRLDIHVCYEEIAARAHELGCRRIVLSHLGSEMLRRLPEVTLECARDGMKLSV